jgi:hypothetical protein
MFKWHKNMVLQKPKTPYGSACEAEVIGIDLISYDMWFLNQELYIFLNFKCI